MPFVPWNELSPAGGDAAATADDRIRELKVQIRERLDLLFNDWDTAVDRITQNKLLTAATHLAIKNDLDAVDIIKIFNTGGLAQYLPFIASIRYDGTVMTGIGSPVRWTATPVEMLDPHNWHDGAVEPWRFTIPAGMNGNYFLSYHATIEGAASAGGVGIGLYKNGIPIGVAHRTFFTDTTVKSSTYLRAPVSLVATDYVEPWIIGAPQAPYGFSDLHFTLELINLI